MTSCMANVLGEESLCVDNKDNFNVTRHNPARNMTGMGCELVYLPYVINQHGPFIKDRTRPTFVMFYLIL